MANGNNEETQCQRSYMIFRYIYSTILSLFMFFVLFYGIIEGYAVLPGSPGLHLFLLIFCVTLLAYLEGLQVAILALENDVVDEQIYPRGYAVHALATKGINVRRFLIGRQFFVVFVVFLIAQVSTFPDIPSLGVPDWIFTAVIKTGFPGVLLVLSFGQLIPQLLAAIYPRMICNLIGSMQVVQLTLILEFVGITHFSWLMTGVCQRIFNMREEGRQEADVSGLGKYEKMDQMESLLGVLRPQEYNESELLEVAAQGVQPTSSDREELAMWIEHGFAKDVKNYPGPGAFIKHLMEQNKDVPCFLLPPDHPQHIPPHIIAFMLYSNKQAPSMEEVIVHDFTNQ